MQEKSKKETKRTHGKQEMQNYTAGIGPTTPAIILNVNELNSPPERFSRENTRAKASLVPFYEAHSGNEAEREGSE